MGYILRLPSITAYSDAEKIEQIRTYLYQTIKDIEWSLNSLDTSNGATVEARETDANSTFALVKPLIISSADILNSYYNTIKSRLDDVYLNKNEYNKHREVTGSITSYAESCGIGMTPIYTTSTASGMPDGFGNSVGYIHKVEDTMLIQLSDITTGIYATKSFNNGWNAWKILIPE